MDFRFEEVPLTAVPWQDLDRYADRTVHQTQGWLAFLAETQRAEPMVLRIWCGGEALGWFTGAIVRRYGVRIMGSPMRGWTTSHMGFNLSDDPIIGDVTLALRRHVLHEMRCGHLELMDRRFVGRTEPPAFRSTPLHGLEIAIDRDDDQLMAAMTKRGRRDVRRAQRLGAEVEEVEANDPSFVAEHWAQVCETFARQGLKPSYDEARVRAMIRHLHPSGHLVLLRVRMPGGEPVASGIFAGMARGTASFTFQASRTDLRSSYPNELIVWEALRRWRDRGATRFDLGGTTEFKQKFGGTPVTTDWLRTSKFEALERARSVAARLAGARARRSAPGSRFPT